jgi:hypothetical protein
MVGAGSGKPAFEALLAAIVAADAPAAARILPTSPALALAHWDEGEHYFERVEPEDRAIDGGEHQHRGQGAEGSGR